MKWIKGSHNLSVLLGTYERSQSKVFFERASHAKVFWDLGAHVGYYSLLYRAANSSGTVVAFEPLPANVKQFNEHMKLNHISGLVLYQNAVSDKHEVLNFSTGTNSVAGKLSDQGNLSVEAIQISNWLKEGTVSVPELIKMDIEGEESKVLADLASMLRSHKPEIFLSTHGEKVHRECIDFLKSMGYALKPLDSKDLDACRELLAY